MLCVPVRDEEGDPVGRFNYVGSSAREGAWRELFRGAKWQRLKKWPLLK